MTTNENHHEKVVMIVACQNFGTKNWNETPGLCVDIWINLVLQLNEKFLPNVRWAVFFTNIMRLGAMHLKNNYTLVFSSIATKLQKASLHVWVLRSSLRTGANRVLLRSIFVDSPNIDRIWESRYNTTQYILHKRRRKRHVCIIWGYVLCIVLHYNLRSRENVCNNIELYGCPFLVFDVN